MDVEELFEPDIPFRLGSEIARGNLESVKSWFQQGNLRLYEGDRFEGGRRERKIAPITVIAIALTVALVRAGISSRRAGKLAMAFAFTNSGGVTSGWVGEPDDGRPTRRPGRLFSDSCPGVETWAAFWPDGDEPGQIIPVPWDEPIGRTYERLPGREAGRGLLIVPLDEVVEATMVRCHSELRRLRQAAEIVDGAA